MVTVTPHLLNAIGLLTVSEDPSRGVFTQLVAKDTAVPFRRAAIVNAPKGGGDVIVKICEGAREIKVSKPEVKPKTNGSASKKGDSDDDDSDLDDSDDEEPEEVREKVWKAGKILAEAAVREVKKGGKVEVTINVGKDLGVQVTAREVGGKGGVRGALDKPKGTENGSA